MIAPSSGPCVKSVTVLNPASVDCSHNHDGQLSVLSVSWGDHVKDHSVIPDSNPPSRPPFNELHGSIPRGPQFALTRKRRQHPSLTSIGRKKLANVLPNTSATVSAESSGIGNVRWHDSFTRSRQAAAEPARPSNSSLSSTASHVVELTLAPAAASLTADPLLVSASTSPISLCSTSFHHTRRRRCRPATHRE